MYCSHKQFINIATATGVETSALGHMLSDILSLVQCRGSMVKSSRFQEVVANVAPETAKMMQLLHKVDKLDATSLKALVSIV